jgi:hypothetical protein
MIRVSATSAIEFSFSRKSFDSSVIRATSSARLP